MVKQILSTQSVATTKKLEEIEKNETEKKRALNHTRKTFLGRLGKLSKIKGKKKNDEER